MLGPAERIADGRLVVKQLWIDTTEHLITTVPEGSAAAKPPSAHP
ncbi:MAG: hypothetical protein AMXMBFR34_00480 [Myxococcaceae bacterium]